MKDAINNLQTNAEEFIVVAEKVKLNKQVYDNGWNAKHIIAHIVYYHEYYASVVSALAANAQLPLIDESLAKVNIRSAQEYSKINRTQLIKRFITAEKKLTTALLRLTDTTEIPYKKGGRIYKAVDYANEIARHILKHSKDLKRESRK